MTRQINISKTSHQSEVNRVEYSKIISEFCIRNSCYRIIHQEDYKKNIQENSLRICADSIDLSSIEISKPVGQFEVDGELYVIVLANQHFEHITPSGAEILTERESQIAALVALGHSNKQVAHQLHISEWTVSAHLRRIFIKLGVDSRAAMVYHCASLIQRLHQA